MTPELMSNRTLSLTPPLYDYLLDNSLRESSVLKRLRTLTLELPESRMQIAPEQGQFMALLVELIGARRIVEVGVFTGYSALWMASALPPDGQLIACDSSKEWTDIALPFWREAGVSERIERRLGAAAETLADLLEHGEANRFDLAFIDADKENYDTYYEACLSLVRPGGIILFDNMLWSGRVADADQQDADTQAIRALNAKLHDDARISLSLIPIGDGLCLARKR
jgi:predicted O-methyltransferase YrrM